MNGRINEAETPEGRLSAVVVTVLRGRPESEWWTLDYADFEEALKPYVQRELINERLAEIRENRTAARDRVVMRERELFQRLAEVEAVIATAKAKAK